MQKLFLRFPWIPSHPQALHTRLREMKLEELLHVHFMHMPLLVITSHLSKKGTGFPGSPTISRDSVTRVVYRYVENLALGNVDLPAASFEMNLKGQPFYECSVCA